MLLVAYLGLFGLWAAAQVVIIPVPVNVIVTSVLIIYVGSHLSLRLRDKDHPDNADSEQISQKDAMKFPLTGSAVLFGLYCAYKYLDKDMVNLLLSLYFSLIGALTLAGTVDPVVHRVVTSEKIMGKKFNLPLLGEVDLTFTPSLALSLIVGTAFSVVYFQTKHWAMNNVFGISFCVQALEKISIGSYTNGLIMLCGLFFYDIFWVFGTDVMVTVAKSFDGPIKLLFPRQFADPLADPPLKAEFSMLGLGDIIVPGLFIALLIRFDAERASADVSLAELATFRKPFFHSNMVGYAGGLAATLYIMYSFNAAQPALLYLVPACLLTSLLCGLLSGQVGALVKYTEEEEEEGKGEAAGEKDGERSKAATNGAPSKKTE
jgi:minor histocompatibility antigen H13